MTDLATLGVLTAFAAVLLHAGWHPGDPVGAGSPLHQAYRQATTATFAGIVACQVGTAFASRAEVASSRDVGWRSNPLLLWGVAFANIVHGVPIDHSKTYVGGFFTLLFIIEHLTIGRPRAEADPHSAPAQPVAFE